MKPARKRCYNASTDRHERQKSSGTYVIAKDDFLSFEEDELTPVKLACLACKGHGFLLRESQTSYVRSRCLWCSDGAMDGNQVNVYLNHDKLVEEMLKRYVEEQG